jgi:hypothetical protein
MKLLLIVSAIVLLCITPLSAQPSPAQVTAYRDDFVFAGPGISHWAVSPLRAGVPWDVIERTPDGTWLRVQRGSIEGWVITGYLNLPNGFRLSDLPVNTTAIYGDPATQRAASVAELYMPPILSPISPTVHALFAQGQWLGIQPNVITKVGDSLSADHLYLEPMARGDHELGAYDFLAPALDYYGASAAPSVAARVGMTSYVIFDPMWADAEHCQPGETPLACEYRLRMPAVSFIMFGSNDVMRMTDEQFDVQLRLIVQETMARGIIPVLSTFSYHPESALWWQSVNFNRRIIAIASEYQIPLINLWAAARHLPRYGLDVDNIHLLHSGWEHLKFSGGDEAWYGATLRNLLSVAMLEQIRQSLGLGDAP